MLVESPTFVPLPSALGNRALLRQGADLVRQLDPARFAQARPGHSSVGAQFRHVLEHYAAFLAGLACGRVDYDARPREAALEREPTLAAHAARRYAAAMDAFDLASGDAGIEVQSDAGAADGRADWRATTIGRELQFLSSHTVHHYALIRLLLELDGVATDASFGVAPSTLAHRVAHG
jgi:uncharacterized damage-inducible protein DinB